MYEKSMTRLRIRLLTSLIYEPCHNLDGLTIQNVKFVLVIRVNVMLLE